MYDPKPQLRPAITHRVAYADNAPILQLRWSPTPRAGEDAREQITGATYAISEDGGAGSKLRITLTEVVKDEAGDPGSNKVYTYDGNGTTLGAIVKAINAADHGFQARVLHAPTDFSVDSDDFIAETATPLPTGGPDPWVSCLKRAVATSNRVYLRIGNPEVQDIGRYCLVRLQNIVTNATGAVGTLYSDPEGGPKKAIRSGIAPTTSWTKHIDSEPMRAEIVRGPLLVDFGATNSTGAAVELTVVQAER